MQGPRIPFAPAVVAATLAAGLGLVATAPEPLPFAFVNVAREACLHGATVYGGRDRNRYLLETTGSGVALIDVDRDGWLDVFVVNGTTLEGFPPGQEPTTRLYHNRRDGTFEDVTDRTGLRQSGWGQPASVTTTPTGATTSS